MLFNKRNKEKTVMNYEGEVAYALSPEFELYTAVVTTTLSDVFYEKADERIERIAQLVGEVEPEFVARLAVYARNVMNLRSVPILLVVELARQHSGDDLVSRTIDKVVMRADEIMELLACYQARNNRGDRVKKLGRVSNQILKGLKHAFNRFDEYQFAKYNRDGLEVKLRDALFLVHPKAKDEAQQAIFDKIVNGTLETPYTWETELSEAGKNGTSKRKVWQQLVASQRLGYMAMLRNLRNILLADVDKATVNVVCDNIADPRAVARSKQFPFRFLSAYREIPAISGYAHKVLDALEKAVLASAQNIAGFDAHTRVLLASDTSGSMYWSGPSSKSSVKLYDIGLMLSMLLQHRCDNVVTGIFGNTWMPVALPHENILANCAKLKNLEGKVGYATNGYKVIEWLLQEHRVMDKVMFFTDCQMWNTGNDIHIKDLWIKYRNEIAPKAKLYLFDLAGYGNTPLQIEQNGVFLISGWSDKVFDTLQAIEQGGRALDEINKIEL